MSEEQILGPILKHSDQLLAMIKDKAGVELDYSLGSLLHLDKILEHLFGKGMSSIPRGEEMEEVWSALRVQIACYYGECIRRTFSGVWAQDEKMGIIVKEIGNLDVTIHPLHTAFDRLNGEDYKIFFTTKVLCDKLFKQINEKHYHLGEQAKPSPATPPPLPPN